MKMTQSEHSRYHHEKSPPTEMQCPQCGKQFAVQYNIISQHLKEGRKYGQRFCSRKCGTDFKKGKRAKSYRGLTVAKVRQIKKILATNDRHRVAKAASEFGISKSAVYAIKYGENWSDVR